VRDPAWLKLIELVRHKLSADDARIEIGGRPPDDPRIVAIEVDAACRLVALFQAPPEDRTAVSERLEALLTGFRDTLSSSSEPPRSLPSIPAGTQLHDALLALSARTGAETIWIIDSRSPVLWASSEIHAPNLDLDAMVLVARADQMLEAASVTWAELLSTSPEAARTRLEAANLTGVTLRTVESQLGSLFALVDHGGMRAAAQRLRSARALVEIRERAARDKDLVRTELRGPRIQAFAHAIATQYQLVLVFDDTYSPLHAEGNVQRALPHIERLLLSLPPVDPVSGGASGAKVIRLPRKG
jgi:hypothetical protein